MVDPIVGEDVDGVEVMEMEVEGEVEVEEAGNPEGTAGPVHVGSTISSLDELAKNAMPQSPEEVCYWLLLTKHVIVVTICSLSNWPFRRR